MTAPDPQTKLTHDVYELLVQEKRRRRQLEEQLQAYTELRTCVESLQTVAETRARGEDAYQPGWISADWVADRCRHMLSLTAGSSV